ncbi:MAG: S-layer homology domain-containing protein [Treponematales bacterium]
MGKITKNEMRKKAPPRAAALLAAGALWGGIALLFVLALGLGGCPMEDEGDLTLTGNGWSYDSAAGVYIIAGGAVVEVTGSTTGSRVVVNGVAKITLSNASIVLSGGEASPLDLAEGANLTLRLAGTNTLTASGGAAGIHVPAGRTLTVTSAAWDGSQSGRLTVTGSAFFTGDESGGGAGIGGNANEDGGSITITGGTITARGGSAVNGTDVTGGAGIGGGAAGSGGTISVTGGSVTAEGGPCSAGIGGGAYGGAGGDISVTGGTITAIAGAAGAGIGGGYEGAGGTIRINSPGGTSQGTAAGSGGYGGRSVGPGRDGSGGSFSGPDGEFGLDEDGFPIGCDTYEWFR